LVKYSDKNFGYAASGSYQSPVHDFGQSVSFANLAVNFQLNGQNLKALVEVSDSVSMSPVKGSINFNLTQGQQNYALNSLPKARYVRVKYDFSSVNNSTTPFLSSSRIGVQGEGQTSFSGGLILQNASADPSITWQKIYDKGGSESPLFTATDPADNIIVAGKDSSNRLILLKYSPQGSLVWEKMPVNDFPELVQSDDQVRTLSMAVLPDGSIVVLMMTPYRPWLMKYDSQGRALWLRNLASSPNLGSNFNFGAIAYSKLDNTLVLSGGSNSNKVFKLSADGSSVVWTVSNPDINVSYVSIAVDSLGAVYAGGRNSSGSNNSIIVKYSSTGNVLWSKQYSAVGGSDVRYSNVFFLEPDPAGNIIAGFGEIFSSPSVIKIAKISSADGNILSGINSNLLMVYEGGSVNSSIRGGNMPLVRVDSSGNILAVGKISSSSTKITTKKYDPNFNLFWSFDYTAEDTGGMAPDSKKDIAVSFKTSLATSDITLVKYSDRAQGYVVSGAYQSTIHDFGSQVSFTKFDTSATLNGQRAEAILEVSDDFFTTIKHSKIFNLPDGAGTFAINDFPFARYARIKVNLSTANSQLTPLVRSLKVVVNYPSQ